MGLFNVTIDIGSPGVEVSAMVDSGSIHTMAPESLLTRLGIAPLDRIGYALADGSVVEYDYGMAPISIDGIDAPGRYCPVIFGPDDEFLLGATTLEIFNLMADPVEGRLVPRVFRARPV